MIRFVFLVITAFHAAFRSRSELLVENLALRQQLAVLAGKGRRARVTGIDRWFWVALRRFWSRWAEALVIVKPETVVRWHRAGFRRYWTWLSRRRLPGRPRAKESVRAAIRRMATENPSWGAPRIHGELLMVGFVVSESTVSRYMPRHRGQPDALQRWLTFLRNHRGAIAGMDFFVVPTVTFRPLYAWFVNDHQRRRILRFGVTDGPTAAWVIQQLRETFGVDNPVRHLVFDRDAIFSAQVVATLKSFAVSPMRTSYRSPWQNGVAERWVGSVRRELLDHVVVLGERHLELLLRDYVAYYHDDRTHLALGKQTPACRRPEPRVEGARLIGHRRLGGVHHRYQVAA